MKVLLQVEDTQLFVMAKLSIPPDIEPDENLLTALETAEEADCPAIILDPQKLSEKGKVAMCQEILDTGGKKYNMFVKLVEKDTT